MYAFPRTLAVMLVVVMATMPLHFAAADTCIRTHNSASAEALTIIANTGRQIAVGLKAPHPGDGFGVTAIFTPMECGSGGFGMGEPSGQEVSDLVGDTAKWVTDQAPSFLGLP